MKLKVIASLAVALTLSATLAGCASAQSEEPPAEVPEIVAPAEPEAPTVTEQPQIEEPVPEVNPPVVTPQIKTVSYITVTSDSVNFRSGAGTNYYVSGQAEKNTLYACLGEVNGWYKTYYKNKTVYISKKYCVIVDMQKGADKIEDVIAEGTKLLGTPYVYGAVRVHDGKGNKLKGFTTSAFDCSSLMQYMFYKGADKLIDVNTRTQIYQGTTVSRQNLKRGDLMFFTNASRKNNKGIERVGHVAMYLGDNYILHTASDYAKIEKISSLRWSYFIQAQRMI
ncbi:MAG: C40 family peptidase [Clostridia bacterium]|nr:C40 family peptidase [Clostridia bacterium]